MSNDNESNNTASGGVGLTGLVFLVFLVLKLTGTDPVASWSWWWVTCPLWAVFALLLAFAMVAGTVGLVGWILGSITTRNNWKRHL